jgi:hypothetical protein
MRPPVTAWWTLMERRFQALNLHRGEGKRSGRPGEEVEVTRKLRDGGGARHVGSRPNGRWRRGI